MAQLQLFDPGPEDQDPWKHSPENWLKQPDIAWHASNEQRLPRVDRTVSNPTEFNAEQFIQYGHAAGMHFGTLRAARERSESAMYGRRAFIHPARMVGPQYVPNFGDGTSGEGTNIVTDEHANYSHIANDAVRRGEVVHYRNDMEDHGSTSYRALPEATRTWSEEVNTDDTAHPALKYYAERGYNPKIDEQRSIEIESDLQRRQKDLGENGPTQHRLWDAELRNDEGQMVAAGSIMAMQRRQRLNGDQFKVLDTNGGYGPDAMAERVSIRKDAEERKNTPILMRDKKKGKVDRPSDPGLF